LRAVGIGQGWGKREGSPRMAGGVGRSREDPVGPKPRRVPPRLRHGRGAEWEGREWSGSNCRSGTRNGKGLYRFKLLICVHACPIFCCPNVGSLFAPSNSGPAAARTSHRPIHSWNAPVPALLSSAAIHASRHSKPCTSSAASCPAASCCVALSSRACALTEVKTARTVSLAVPGEAIAASTSSRSGESEPRACPNSIRAKIRAQIGASIALLKQS
jgi:hypothetical protein